MFIFKLQLPQRQLPLIVLVSILGATAFASNSDSVAKHAIKAGLRGDEAKRDVLLDAALESDPNGELANWARGKVRVGEDWLAADEVEKRFADSTKLDAYALRRDAVLDSQANDWHLANWCRGQKMFDAEKLHLNRVLESRNTSLQQKADAIGRLGLRNVGGMWFTPEELGNFQGAVRKSQQDAERWSSRVRKLVDTLERNSGAKGKFATQEFRRDLTSDGIVTIERLMSVKSESLANVAVQLISELSSIDATESLVRHAVFSSWPSVRSNSVNELKKRKQVDTVPLLLSELMTPLRSRYGVTIGPDGMVRHLHQVYEQGRTSDVMHVGASARSPHELTVVQNVVDGRGRVIGQIHPDDVLVRRMIRASGISDEATLQIEAEIRMYLALARRNLLYQEVQKAEGLTRQIAARNMKAEDKNTYVMAALREITSAEVEPNATSWWSWWTKENERYETEKPTYTRYASYSDPATVQTVPSSASQQIRVTDRMGYECFPAGTMVRTQRGSKAIEKIRAGDRVLSQHIETGELTYKIVLTTTERPPSEQVKIQLNEGTLTSTSGHLFWINNFGWKMAKHLQPGDELHSLKRGIKVEEVSGAKKAVAYNLVVADFATYFVGEQDLLTHDNTEQTPTRAISPGISAE